jgi:hypothetical protein
MQLELSKEDRIFNGISKGSRSAAITSQNHSSLPYLKMEASFSLLRSRLAILTLATTYQLTKIILTKNQRHTLAIF